MGGEEGGFSGLSGWANLYYRRNVAEDSAFCRLHGTGRLRSGADLGFVRMPLLQLVVACDSELPGAEVPLVGLRNSHGPDIGSREGTGPRRRLLAKTKSLLLFFIKKDAQSHPLLSLHNLAITKWTAGKPHIDRYARSTLREGWERSVWAMFTQFDSVEATPL